MRGRKPTPTAFKVLAGNPGGRKLPENEPEVAPARPAPPDHLDELAAREWNRVVDELYACKVMTNLDVGVLAAYCYSFAEWVKATSEVRKYGSIVRSPNNFPVRSPFVDLANTHYKNMLRAASELGMSPSSRSRVTKAEGQGGDQDEFARFEKRA